MRKEINSKSKRKWVLGGVAAFASVALVTTGFATWIIGVHETNTSGDVSVGVDTAKNESITFKAELSDNSIRLAETQNTDVGDFIQTDAIDGDLAIIFSTIEITYGAQSNFDFTEINLSIAAASGEYVDQNTPMGADLIDQREGDDFTYFDLNTTTITLPTTGTGTVTDNNGQNQGTYIVTKETNLTKIVLSNVKVDFQWGTFFNHQSPCTYYNSIFDTPEEQTSDNAEKVTNELNAMHGQLNDKKIKVSLDLAK